LRIQRSSDSLAVCCITSATLKIPQGAGISSLAGKTPLNAIFSLPLLEP
jgi:hypothetical protein